MTEVISPPADSFCVMPEGKICVIGFMTSRPDYGQIALVLKNEPVDWTHQNVLTVDTNNDFPVLASYAGTDTPTDTSEYDVWLRMVSQGQTVDLASNTFTRMPQTSNRTVFARQSLWYAFTEDTSGAGPNGYDDPISNHTPEGPIQIPWNADTVTFSVSQDEPWTHDTNNQNASADPGGRTDIEPVGLQVDEYQSAEYDSEVIKKLEANVCALAGLWKNTDSHGEPYKQFPIGNGGTPINVPSDAQDHGDLYLGMHDGKRWHNNSGEASVQIFWEPEGCAKLFNRLQRAGRIPY